MMFIFYLHSKTMADHNVFGVAQLWSEEAVQEAAEQNPSTIYFFGTIKERYYEGAETA